MPQPLAMWVPRIRHILGAALHENYFDGHRALTLVHHSAM